MSSDGRLVKRESPDDNVRDIKIRYLVGEAVREAVFNPVRYECKMWLSVEAQEGLINMATALRCGPYIGSILSALPRNPLLYRDNRPDELTSLDVDLLELGRFPQWCMEYAAYPFNVAVPRGTQVKLLTIAMHWGITNYRIPASYRQPLSRMVAVAEAIGTHMLTYVLSDDMSAAYPPVQS